MSDDHEGTLGERLATRLAHIADAMEKGEPLKSTTVVRVAGDEAALRIIVRQQRAEIGRLAAEVQRLRMSEKERDAIADCADAADVHGHGGIAATLRALNDRHARETVAG